MSIIAENANSRMRNELHVNSTEQVLCDNEHSEMRFDDRH